MAPQDVSDRHEGPWNIHDTGCHLPGEIRTTETIENEDISDIKWKACQIGDKEKAELDEDRASLGVDLVHQQAFHCFLEVSERLDVHEWKQDVTENQQYVFDKH